MATFTTISNQEFHEVLIEDAAAGETNWTVSKHCRPGDRILLYICAPVSAIVAVGILASQPEEVTVPSSIWFGHWLADITELRMLDQPLSRQTLLSEFPIWGYWRQPRNSVRVPEEYLPRLELLLKQSPLEENPFGRLIEGAWGGNLLILDKENNYE
jgi:hypothetical protein